MKIHLTQELVNKAKPIEGSRKRELCDIHNPGLLCEVRLNSSSYMLRYKDLSGRTRYFNLGLTTEISLAQARSMARDKQAEIRLGADPSGDLRKQKAVMTFREFTEEYYLPWAYAHKRSARDDENRLRQRLLPAFGDLALNTITRKQLVEFIFHLRKLD